MVKIYTKTGDSGTTSLFGGKRLSKDDARIEAYGQVDELNSLIGVIVAEINNNNVILRRMPKNLDPSLTAQDDNWRKLLIRKLLRIQKELFVLGSDLATPSEVKVKIPRVTKPFVTRLEQEIDSWDKNLPKLRNFILPGGSKVGAHLHLARSIARRAERSIVKLTEEEKINKQSLRSSSFGELRTAGLKNAQIYINRLSDWLFVLARFVNKLDNKSEVIWKGRK